MDVVPPDQLIENAKGMENVNANLIFEETSAKNVKKVSMDIQSAKVVIFYSILVKFKKIINVLECDCDSQGTIQDICVRHNGQCLCRDGFDGKKCEKCGEGFFAFPKCLGRFQMLLYSFLHAIKYL